MLYYLHILFLKSLCFFKGAHFVKKKLEVEKLELPSGFNKITFAFWPMDVHFDWSKTISNYSNN